MSTVINVLFSTMRGSKLPAQLKNDFTAGDIWKLVQEKFGSTNYRLIVNGKEIPEEDPVIFAELRQSIRNNTIIYVCQRMMGGSCLIDVDTHSATILNELHDEVQKMRAQTASLECMICNEDKECLRICCSTNVCKECFSKSFVHNKYKTVCLVCNKTVDPEKVFVTEAFISSLDQLDQTRTMKRNIDFQICTCGALLINDTMYAKQQCANCHRWMCFFCNADWDEKVKKMRNERYSCRMNCDWEVKITFQLVTLESNREMQVPSRRCCPKCFECGSYDQKCKYHTCGCKHTFCFICLKPQEECQSLYGSAFNRPCATVAQQSYTMFPRLCGVGEPLSLNRPRRTIFTVLNSIFCSSE